MRFAVLVLCTVLAATACIVVASLRSEGSAQAAKSKSLPSPVRLARADAAKRRHVRVSQVRVVSVTAKTWPDGCLGLAKPGQFCTQALVEGYRATFVARGRRLVYRTDRKARFKLQPG